MSFFKGKLRITEGSITGTAITMDENLIMGSNKITGLGTDASSITDPTDAANKAYVDQVSGGVPFIVTLTGNATTQLSTVTKGSYLVIVTNIIAGGPSGIFSISKRDSSESASQMRMSHAKGSENENLILVWNPIPHIPEEYGIRLKKITSSPEHSNGTYSVILIGTDGS